MALSLLLAVLSAGLFIIGVLVLRAGELRRVMLGARTFQLHFPRNTDPAAVTTFIAGLAGTRPAWFWRWLRLPTVIFEVHAVHGHIFHYIVVPRALTGAVMSHLRAALPSVRLDPPEDVAPPLVTAATELGLSTSRRPLRAGQQAAIAPALLTSLQPLRSGERVVVQWLLTPAPLSRPPRLMSKADKPGNSLADLVQVDGYDLSPHAEALKAQRSKQAEPLFGCVGRIAVQAATPYRNRYLVDRIAGTYQLLSAPGVELRRRRFVTSRTASRRVMRRTVPLAEWPALLNAAEVAGVMGWPVGISQLPGLMLGGCRQLPQPSTFQAVAASWRKRRSPAASGPWLSLRLTGCCTPISAARPVAARARCCST